MAQPEKAFKGAKVPPMAAKPLNAFPVVFSVGERRGYSLEPFLRPRVGGGGGLIPPGLDVSFCLLKFRLYQGFPTLNMG